MGAVEPSMIEPHLFEGGCLGYLGTGMIEHHIHHQFHASFMYFVAQLFPVFHSPKHWINSFVICDIITLVFKRRFINRSQPNHVNSESFEVVKPLDYPLKITNSIIVAVLERLHVNFVDDDLSPPNAVQIQDHRLVQV